MKAGLGTLIAGVLAVTLLAPPASADPAPELALSAPASFPMHGTLPLTGRLSGQANAAAQPVRLEQQNGLFWTTVGTATSDSAGNLALGVRFGATSTYRLVFDGGNGMPAAVSDPVTVTGTLRATVLTVSGTWWLTDETTRTLTAGYRSDLGEPIPGALVTAWTRAPGGVWRAGPSAVTSADGSARLVLAPRTDVDVRVTGPAGSWWAGAASGVHRLDNRPPARPLAYPRTAPRPRTIPAQARAVGAGPNAVITRIPDAVWRSMRWRSWHPGCPVGRSQLRLLRINYFDFDGYRRRGELVVRSDIAVRAAAALGDMYRGRYPIRRMYRVDRFGWSRTQQGADDLASMRADNTSGFNCRSVTGWPGRRSPHSYGRSIDLNPFENPFVSRAGVVPNRWWLYRSNARVAWRSSTHPVVRIWRKHGFRWSYPHSDTQHWDGRMWIPDVPRGSFTASFTSGGVTAG